MGSTNIGNQLVHWNYIQLLSSANMNKRMQSINPVGIYAGGQISIAVGDVILGPAVIEISDGTYQARIETQSNVAISATTTNNRIVIRYNYQETDDWYADILAIDPATTQPNDVIAGDVIFSGGLPIDVSYRNRTYPDFGLTHILQETFTATEGQQVFTLTNDYYAGTNTLWVFVNGVKQIAGSSYNEDTINGKTITFITQLTEGDEVEVLIFRKE